MAGVPQKYSRDDLSEKRAAFLDAYLASGGDRTAATHAVMQLYGYPKRQASQYAARLLKDEKIRSILAEEAGTSFAATAWLASERLAEILATGQWFGQSVKPGDGLKAIKDALDRGGFAIAKMVDVRVTDDTKSPQEKLAEVKAMLNQLGGNEKQAILAAIGSEDIIDADFEPLPDPDAPWGRTKDGAPKKKPGNKPIEKRILPGPDAYRPPADKIKSIKDRILSKKVAQKTGEKDGE